MATAYSGFVCQQPWGTIVVITLGTYHRTSLSDCRLHGRQLIPPPSNVKLLHALARDLRKVPINVTSKCSCITESRDKIQKQQLNVSSAQLAIHASGDLS